MSFLPIALKSQISGAVSARSAGLQLALLLSLLLAACQSSDTRNQAKGTNQSNAGQNQGLAETGAALRLAQKNHGPQSEQALVLMQRMKTLLLQAGAPKRALYYAKQIFAIRQKRAVAERVKSAQAALQLAELYSRTGARIDALQAYRQAIKIFNETPGQSRMALRAELRFGLLLHDLGHFDAAEGLLRSLLAKISRPEYRDIFQTHNVNAREIIDRLVIIRRVRGDLAGVAALLKLARHSGPVEPRLNASLARRIAVLDGETGNHRLARSNLLRLLKQHRKAAKPNREIETDLIEAIIETYIKGARYDVAAKLIDRVVRRRREQPGSVPVSRINALLQAAAQSRAIRRIDNAKLYQARAARLAKQLGTGQPELGRLLRLSKLRNLLAERKPATARALALDLDRLLVASHGEWNLRRIAGLRLAAKAAALQKDLVKADQLLFLACEIARKNLGPWDPKTVSLYGELAAIRAKRKMPDGRLTAITAASFAQQGQFRSALLSTYPDRQDKLRQAREIFVRHVDAVATRLSGKEILSPKRQRKLLAQAFDAMQLARAADMAQRQKTLAASFENASANPAAGPGLAQDLKRRQDLAYQLKLARRQLWQMQWHGKSAVAEKQKAVVKLLWERQQDRDWKFSNKQTGFVRLSGFSAMDLDRAQSILSDGETLLLYLTSRNKNFVFALRQKEAALLPLRAAGPQLARRVKRLRQRLDPTRTANRRRDFQYDVTGAFALYRLLLAPVKNRLGLNGRLLIVPDGALASLPFAGLVSKLPGATEKINANYYLAAPWLVRDHPILILPSVHGLGSQTPANIKVADTKAAGKADAGTKFLAFADPAFSGADRGLRGISTSTVFASASVASAGFVRRAKLMALPNLPETSGEMFTLAASLSAPRRAVILQEKVREEAIKALNGKTFSVLALASHGLITGDFQNFGEPGLAFAPPTDGSRQSTRSQSNDGVLRLGEIAGLKLKTKWLVLSALNTVDVDSKANARGLAPLILALQHAGAENILAAHWSVAPRPMAQMVAETIKTTTAKRPLDYVLRDLMLKMILNVDAPELRHPMMWAPLFAITQQK